MMLCPYVAPESDYQKCRIEFHT